MLTLLSHENFRKCRREPLLDYNIYYQQAEDLISRLERSARNMADVVWMSSRDVAIHMQLTHVRAKFYTDLLELNYSAGDSLINLRSIYSQALDAWEIYDNYNRQFDTETEEGRNSTVGNFGLRSEAFSLVNRMLSMSVLLGWPQLLARLFPIIDYRNPRDGMLERTFKHYGVVEALTTSECTRHLPYFKTLKIFDAQQSDRPSLVKEYLADWYSASRREPYYESHKRGDSFKGYWAWEAAVITVMLDIDDSSYRNDKFYPADAVAFARQCQQDYAPAGLPPIEQNELRAKAGDPCPKPGLWQSLDTPSQTVRFEAGQEMADLKSVYGLTVWRFQQ